MGHGPSTSNKSAVARRTSSERNHSFVDSNPDPEYATTMQNGLPDAEPQPQNLRSKPYMSYRRSTASLSKIFQKKGWKKRRGSISASFNMNENDIRVELINVNTATEEELMTLHGVNRALAQNIVNHRELIGGFRKIEDLALVSGMGASKLIQVRPEICISRRRPGMSLASSKAPSIESIPSTAELNRPASNMSRCMKLVNINQASIFDLMTVDGINQATAARIIEYRDRKGPFKSVDDLRRVGIHRRLLADIKVHLTTEDLDSDKSSTISSNSPSRPPRHIMRGKTNGLQTVISNTIQPVGATHQLQDDLRTIYEIMSLKTKRPDFPKCFNYSHNNCPAYRVATWNLESMSLDKIANPGVMEVITRTILENRFSILAVQEICDERVLEKICSELNNPTLRQNLEWSGFRGTWKYALHPSPMRLHEKSYYLGVLYDAQRVDSVNLPKGEEFCPIQNGSLWQFAVFQIESYSATWMLVNVLSVPLESDNRTNGQSEITNQREITESVKSLVQETDGAMILGYFSAQQANKGLRDMSDLEMVLPNSENAQAQPNSLWVTSSLKSHLADVHGVIEDGLSHLAIPNGWGWGGKATQFGPLWCTMYGLESKVNLSDEDCVSEDKESDDYVPAR